MDRPDTLIKRIFTRRAPCKVGVALLVAAALAALVWSDSQWWAEAGPLAMLALAVVGVGLVILCVALGKVQAARNALAAEVVQRRHAEAALKENEALYRAMVQGFPDGVLIVFDSDIKVLAVEGSGLPGIDLSSELVGKTPEELFEAAIGARVQGAARKALADEESVFDISYWGRLVQLHAHPLRVDATMVQGAHAMAVIAMRDVTEARTSQYALAENERRLSTLIANMPGMVYRCVYNEQRTMEFVSDGCRELTGYNRDELTLNRVTSWPKLVHPDDLDELNRTVEESMRRGEPYVATYRIVTADQDEKWVWERGVSIPMENADFTALEGLVLDVTERMRAARRLEEAFAELDQIFNSTGDGMYLMDLDMHYVRVNKTFGEMFSLDPNALVGRSCGEEVQGRSVCPLPCPRGTSPLPGEPLFTRVEMDAQGLQRHFEITTNSLTDASGQEVGYLVTVHEITEQVRAEHSARAREQQLIQADKLAALGTLVAGVAHEINNPNTVISLNAPVMRSIWADVCKILDRQLEDEGDFPLGGGDYSLMRSEVDGLLEKMVDSSRRIRSIVADLKDFARPPSMAEEQRVDLLDMMRTAVRLVEGKLSKSTNNFSLNLPDQPVVVEGDFQRLEQVVVNLLINSCEALDGPEEAVEAMVAVSGEWAEILIRDQGRGMSSKEKAHAVDPFYTTKQEHGGTGLGLSISHGIVKKHGGTISFESEPGRGTICRVRLPLAARLDAAITPS